MPLAKSIAERTPPGQTLTARGKWPVLHYGGIPMVTEEKFQFRIFGEVERELKLSWRELVALPCVALTSDFHCVTTWSKLDNTWEGVLVRTLADLAGIKATARHAMAHAFDGYYTNVPMKWLMDDDVMVAWSHDGQPLTAEHGGPLRLVIPKLYAWKSAKWLSGLELMKEDRRGFWEERGYHNRGEPFAEERYSYQETGSEEEEA